MKKNLSKEDIKKIISLDSTDPFSLLGAHPVKTGKKTSVVIRAFFPESKEVFVVDDSDITNRYQMKMVHESGVYEVSTPQKDIFSYSLEISWNDKSQECIKDPYSFLPVIDANYLHLFNEGTNYNVYERQGAHFITHQGVEGVHFAVWAPNAKRVSVIGDFNRWDGRRHSMRILGSSGIWEIFIPALRENEKYKFEIKDQSGALTLKSDPYGFYSEMRPDTASITYEIDRYEWDDAEWMQKRRLSNHLDAPLSIYEVHLGSWARAVEKENSFLSYRELAPLLVDYVKKLGYTHLQLLPVQEHPLDDSWGYQAIGYFSPTSRFGTPADFMYFIDYCHQHTIGVIIDWVPGHFPKDAHGLAQFDGTCLYEHQDPRKGEHTDWGTLIFNYGRNEVLSFLISNALFWCKKYHIDGFRVDAVASMLYLDYSREEGEWIPNMFGGNENLEAIHFLKRVNEILHLEFPGILTIAEESTAWTGVSQPTYLGGLGFSMKWNMGWMNDMLDYFTKDPVHRKFHQNSLTFSLMYAFSENFILVISHDEVVYGKQSLLNKMPGGMWQKFANVRLFLGYMFAHPGKKLLFMGSDFGQWDEWNHHKSLDWHLLDGPFHKNLQQYVMDINRLYQSEKSLFEIDFDHHGFEWIDFHDWENSVISFIRRGKDPADYIVCIFNFTPVPREPYIVGVPEHRYYKEILNSDSKEYSGSGKGNLGGIHSEQQPCLDRPYSINITLPPLSVLYFKPA